MVRKIIFNFVTKKSFFFLPHRQIFYLDFIFQMKFIFCSAGKCALLLTGIFCNDRTAILSITSLALHLQSRETDNGLTPPLALHLSLRCGPRPIIDQVKATPRYTVLTAGDIIDISLALCHHQHLYLFLRGRLEV